MEVAWSVALRMKPTVMAAINSTLMPSNNTVERERNAGRAETGFPNTSDSNSTGLLLSRVLLNDFLERLTNATLSMLCAWETASEKASLKAQAVW